MREPDARPGEGFGAWVMRKRRELQPLMREWRLGRLEVRFKWRSPDRPFGRFGGGWQWKLGVQAGGRTVIISLLVCSVTLSWREGGDDS